MVTGNSMREGKGKVNGDGNEQCAVTAIVKGMQGKGKGKGEGEGRGKDETHATAQVHPFSFPRSSLDNLDNLYTPPEKKRRRNNACYLQQHWCSA